jgi:hypothetical protein
MGEPQKPSQAKLNRPWSVAAALLPSLSKSKLNRYTVWVTHLTPHPPPSHPRAHPPTCGGIPLQAVALLKLWATEL